MYEILVTSHAGAAVLSLALFVGRGTLRFQGSAWAAHPAARIAPRAVDTVLLMTAFALLFVIGQYPFVDHWLTVKLVGVVVYILLGAVALGEQASDRARTAAFVGGILVMVYLYAFSLTRQPLLIGG